MPRNVKNFWATLQVDGSEKTTSRGPRARDGGLLITVKQRHRGQLHNVLVISCYEHNGLLTTSIRRLHEAVTQTIPLQGADLAILTKR